MDNMACSRNVGLRVCSDDVADFVLCSKITIKLPYIWWINTYGAQNIL